MVVLQFPFKITVVTQIYYTLTNTKYIFLDKQRWACYASPVVSFLSVCIPCFHPKCDITQIISLKF